MKELNKPYDLQKIILCKNRDNISSIQIDYNLTEVLVNNIAINFNYFKCFEWNAHISLYFFDFIKKEHFILNSQSQTFLCIYHLLSMMPNRKWKITNNFKLFICQFFEQNVAGF